MASIYKKAIDKIQLEHRLTEHDSKAKVSADAKIEYTQELLGPALKSITERVYERKPGDKQTSSYRVNDNCLFDIGNMARRPEQ